MRLVDFIRTVKPDGSVVGFWASLCVLAQGCVLGGLPVISFEKSQIRFVMQCFHAFSKIIENYQKLSIFSNIPIFIDQFLPVPWNTYEKREQNSNKIIWLQFLYIEKTDVRNICLESHFWTLIIDYCRFSNCYKTYNLFKSNWNFILFHMYNKISTEFQHFFRSINAEIKATSQG